jgi:MoxR-like ATPase
MSVEPGISSDEAFGPMHASAGPAQISELRGAVQAEVSKVVLGQEPAVELLLIAALCGGHVLLEAGPGTAKTLLSTAMARVLGVHFKRVQFTPDTTPTEILGQMTRLHGELVFGAAPSSPTCCSRTRSTAPRRAPRLLSSRRCRSGG